MGTPKTYFICHRSFITEIMGHEKHDYFSPHFVSCYQFPCSKDPIIQSLFNIISAHWPVMERAHDYHHGDTLEEAEQGEDLPLDDSLGDAELASELGVAVQALPVVPMPDSQIPETQLDESLPVENPSVPCDCGPEQISDGQDYILPDDQYPLPDELPVPEEHPSSSEGPLADLPDTLSAEWLTPTELDQTPSPPRSNSDGVVEVLDSPRFPTRVLPPEKPANLNENDVAALRERIRQIKFLRQH